MNKESNDSTHSKQKTKKINITKDLKARQYQNNKNQNGRKENQQIRKINQ